MTAPGAPPPRLPDDAAVVLDPAVEVLDAQVERCSFLCHTGLDTGMVVPPGEGLLDFVRSLTGAPALVGALRREYDDAELVDAILASLLARGFAHVASDGGGAVVAPAPRRRAVVIDLDAGPSVDDVCARWGAGATAPEVLLRCARLTDHGATLRGLAARRADGALAAHHVVVRAADVACDAGTLDALVRLRTSVEVDGVDWPAPAAPPPGLAPLVRALVPALVVMAPGRSILDGEARDRCLEWTRQEHVSGVGLRLDPSAFREDEAHAVFHAVRALEDAVGDVVVVNLPGDEVLLGNTDRGWLDGDEPDEARRLRLAYLRWRIPLLRRMEGHCAWSQVPDVEDRWIRDAEDLLPNHPELLGLGPGRSIVDVCGGLGRVARRLSPAVGPDGVVVSVELRRFVTERARRFAYEGGFPNLQFRPGRAERLPLADGSVDAAVNEWTGAIWELGLGPTMVAEMARVVRPGGRVAVTHRLVQLRLDALAEPWVQYDEIFGWVRDAFRHPDLTVVAERVWGQVVPSKGGTKANLWREQFLPRLVDPDDRVFPEDADDAPVKADVYLTMVAERR